jgi:hypothetical protein
MFDPNLVLNVRFFRMEGVYTFGATAASAPSHARAAILGLRAFVAEPSRPPLNTLLPRPASTSTKTRGP